ncbi:cyclic di-GMP phosphodiesterase [Salmonella enterica subsp. enterica]|uniref:Anti-FlhC(2)FlhD(4) factor YdiV n=1 Tax=Salmonella enterica I TaxID=59201 RepID=A0A3S4F5V6_SALET|nr:cyclic di-GMP phosphodiesterase [Salmonella enterica subsp. enterica]
MTLGQLQQFGCQIAIDDFGTGYASYARLKNVDADILKIDGSFIRNIVSNSLDYQIVASICHLARMKNMQVVAGVCRERRNTKRSAVVGDRLSSGIFNWRAAAII